MMLARVRCVADPTVTMTGGARGLERAGEAATAGRVATMPNASNMFSDLPQYPRTVTRPDGARFAPPAAVLAGPSTAANGGVQRPAALPAPRLEELVHAQDRYKYYKRPNVGIVDPAVATMYVHAWVPAAAAPST
ncbi:hypothetical protein EON68_00965 [archaeon]|nr:MAG: hypothetical protein EON68_00965 [archaeon]